MKTNSLKYSPIVLHIMKSIQRGSHMEIFENQAHSLVNTHSKSNTTVEQSRQANPATLNDDVLGTKTAPHKEKKDKCERNLVSSCYSLQWVELL